MIKKLGRITDWVYIVVLAIVTSLIVFANYVPNTILSGWDNLHPEFNLPLNLSRSLSVSWQEYQGLGLLGGMGHGADLVRQLLFVLISPFIQTFDTRYFWTFLMLFVGATGVFFLAKQFITTKLSSLVALISSLFYIFNLATLQTFYTPFETFTGFFGLFPWLLWGVVHYLKKPTKKSLLTFVVISVLATPAFYVQTLFVVWVMVLGIFLLEEIFRNRVKGVKKSLLVITTVLITNAFWLFPSLYFAATSASVITEAKGNVQSTYETYLMNKGFGSIENVGLLKGYWFEYTDAAETGAEVGYLYADWREHSQILQFQIAGYALFIAAVAGIVVQAIRRKSEFNVSIAVGFVVSFFLLSGGSGPLGFIFDWISNNIPLFGQVFRSVFTKWSTVLALFMSLGLGFFIASFDNLKQRISKRVFSLLFSVAFIVCMFVITKPFFDGQLISERMRVTTPQVYFELFDYFKSQPKQNRIAFFPTQSFWGWNFYDWGYRGSGFLWYGIEQPILDRAFDVWSRENETFYHEFSNAVYQNDAELIKKVVDKYDVRYLLIDRSVIVPGADSKIMRFDEMEKILGDLSVPLVWQKEFLSVYDLQSIQETVDSFVYSPENYIEGSNDISYSRFDSVHNAAGDYINSDFITYPFSTLGREEIPNVSYKGDKLILKGEAKNSGELIIPPLPDDQTYTATAKVLYANQKVTIDFDPFYEITQNGKSVFTNDLPNIEINTNENYESLILSLGGGVVLVPNGQSVSVNNIAIVHGEPLSLSVFSGQAQPVALGANYLNQDFNNCWTREGATPFISKNQNGDMISLTVKDAVSCNSTRLGVFGDSLLTVSVPYRSHNGSRPYFCVARENSNECLTDDIFYHSLESDNWTSIDRKVFLKGNTAYWFTLSGRPSNETGKTWTIDYQMPTINSHPQIALYEILPDHWEALNSEHRVKLASGEFETRISLSPIANNIAQGGRESAYNCDVFKRGEVAKNSQGSDVIYTAQNYGASCDFKVLDGLNTHKEYIFRLVGENSGGRGLKFYLYNQGTNRNDLEMLLDRGKFDQSFAILSWNNFNQSEYVFNVETRSFGPEKSVNRLDDVVAYNIPLSWIATWRTQSVPSVKHGNTLDVSAVQKTGTYLYTAKTYSIDGGILALSQGFDTGWLAFADGKILKHYKFNNWANAWEVPAGEHEITIIYWPQLLQFLGFGLLIGAFVVLMVPVPKTNV